jgi:hypothetical protein
VIIPPAPPAPVIIFVPAPPAPAIVFTPAPPPVTEEKKSEKSESETATVKVLVVPTPLTAVTPIPAELTPLPIDFKDNETFVEPEVEKILTKIAVAKLPIFKGVGPFTFALGLTDQASSKSIKDPDLAIGVKVYSQTPGICSVSVKFNKSTSKYTISVTGISNGQCKITAVDKGNSEKFPTATEIKQTITGVPTKKTISVKAKKPTPAPKAGVKEASYKPSTAKK